MPNWNAEHRTTRWPLNRMPRRAGTRACGRGREVSRSEQSPARATGHADAGVHGARPRGIAAWAARGVAATLAAAALLAGCTLPTVAPPAAARREPAEFPLDDYRDLAAQGKPVYRVDAARSIVIIEVRRAGSMARLGHDHVVASHDVAGFVAPGQGRADLWLALDALVVDEPALRAAAGLTTEPSPDDIAGTRRNMLTRVLETDRYPHALISLRELGAGGNPIRLSVRMTLHGVTRSYEAHASYDKGEQALAVSGTMAIDQSDFGIVPLSVLGGAIAVQDRLQIGYRIHALRMP